MTTVKEATTPAPTPNATATAGFGASAAKSAASASNANSKSDGVARTSSSPIVYAAPASNRAETAVITDGGAKLHSIAETTPGQSTDDAIKASAKPGTSSADAARPADAALAAKLAENIKDDPRDAASQLDLQLLRFIHGDSTPIRQHWQICRRKIATRLMHSLTDWRIIAASFVQMTICCSTKK